MLLCVAINRDISLLHCCFLFNYTCHFFVLICFWCFAYCVLFVELNVLVKLFPFRFVSFPFIDSPSYIM